MKVEKVRALIEKLKALQPKPGQDDFERLAKALRLHDKLTVTQLAQRLRPPPR